MRAALLLVLAATAGWVVHATQSPSQIDGVERVKALKHVHQVLNKNREALVTSAGHRRGDGKATQLQRNLQRLQRRDITVTNNATLCDMFWADVQAAMDAMTSVTGCNSDAMALAGDGSLAPKVCGYNTTGNSTEGSCGTDSFMALLAPLYWIYRDTINNQCAVPNGLGIESTENLMGYFAMMHAQCLQDSDGTYCTPVTSLMEYTQRMMNISAPPTDAMKDASCSGCDVIASDALMSISDHLTGGSIDDGQTWSDNAYVYEAMQAPCVAKLTTGQYCTQSRATNPLMDLHCNDVAPADCGTKVAGVLANVCDDICVSNRALGDDVLTDQLGWVCAKGGDGDGMSCYETWVQTLVELEVDYNESVPLPYDLIAMQCAAEMLGSGTCSDQCKGAFNILNAKLGCCLDPFINAMSEAQQNSLFSIGDNLCGVDMYPPCMSSWQTVEFSFTVSGIEPWWIADNMEDVGALIAMDMARMLAFDESKLGMTGYTEGTGKFRMMALFGEGFATTPNPAADAAAFKTMIDTSSSVIFTLPSLSTVVPAHAVIGGLPTLTFDGSVSEAASPVAQDDMMKAVHAMIKIDTLSVNDAELNNKAILNKIRKAFAYVAGVPPHKVSITGIAGSGGGGGDGTGGGTGGGGGGGRNQPNIYINATVLTDTIAKAPRVMMALSNKRLIDAALTMESVGTTSMVGMAVIVAPPPPPANFLDYCEFRAVNMVMADMPSGLRLGIVHCHTDTDLYLKSTIDEMMPPIPSHATAPQVRAALNQSQIPRSDIQARNFAGVSLDFGETIPNYNRELAGNIKLKCGSKTLQQGTEHQPPLNFLYTLSPVRNPAEELWQAFGAYKWPQPKMANIIAFAFMMNEDQGAEITMQDVDECLIDGTFTVQIDQSQATSWKFSDMDGNMPAAGAEAMVRRRVLPCNIDNFNQFADTRIPELVGLLKASTSFQSTNSAMMTYTTIVNHETWVGCKRRMDALYSKTEMEVTLDGIRACSDQSDMTDPCCNEALRWSDCCVPSTKNVNISGVFGSVETQTVTERCGSNADFVTALLEEEFSSVLIATQIPEFGCDAGASRATDPNFWNRLARPVLKCMQQVRGGMSILDKSSCTDNSQCWTKSCSTGDQKQCARAEGSEAAEPVLRCMVSTADTELWDRLAIQLGVDPSVINSFVPESEYDATAWETAVTNFRNQISTPSCAGYMTDMWCVIGLSEADCKNFTGPAWSWSPRELEWIADPAGGGYCKKKQSGYYEHLDDDEALEECKKSFSNPQFGEPDFFCTDPDFYNQGGTTEAECTGMGGSVVTLSDKTFSVHRLRTTEMMDWDDDGNQEVKLALGDEALCTMQKTCNWDSSGYFTGGDETKCVTAENLMLGGQPYQLPSAGLVDPNDPNKKMTCMQCWGPWCHEFWPAQPHQCIVSPWRGDDCAGSTGGGPDNLAGVTAGSGTAGFRCHRDDLNETNSCLDQRVCPIAEKNEWQSESDVYIWNCAESMCMNLSATMEECGDGGREVGDSTIYGSWRPEWKAGSGLCQIYGVWGQNTGWTDANSKTSCASLGGTTWWEGRAWRPGTFNTAETCNTFCDNGEWPPAEQCAGDAAQCDTSCAQCLPSDRTNRMNGVCVFSTPKTEEACSLNSTDGYEWEWDGGLCTWKDNTGTEAACLARGADHSFHTCIQKEDFECAAYCAAVDYMTQEDCDTANSGSLYWRWQDQVCAFHTHVSDRMTSLTCADGTSDTCSSISGCDWDGAACAGTAKGCNTMPGNTEWVGPPGVGGQAVASLLKCDWDEWARCPDQASCESAGDCSDWWAQGGVCLVPSEASSYVDPSDGTVMNSGYVANCWELPAGKDPNHQGYEWAGPGQCIVTRYANGQTTRIGKAECVNTTYPGARWSFRAESQAECDAYGSVCRNPFEDWDIRGGMNQTTCVDKCELKYSKIADFRAGVWAPAPEVPLYWKQRAVESANTWDPDSVSDAKFTNFVYNGIASLTASMLETKVLCNLDALTGWVPLITDLCGEEGGSAVSELVFSLNKDTLACGKLDGAAPVINYHGSYVPGAGSTCSAGGNSVDISFQKTVPVDAPTRRLLLSANRRNLADCTAHRVITNAAGAVIGQKVGAGLSQSGLNNVQMCINPTVTARCSEYTVRDIVEYSPRLGQNSYSAPLEKTVTLNAQGYYCFSGAVAGKTYVPVHLQADWKTATPSATPAPTPAATPAPTPADTTTPAPTTTPAGGTPAPTPASTPKPTTMGVANTVSGTQSLAVAGTSSSTTLSVDAGSGSVTATVLAAVNGGEEKVQLALGNGVNVNIPLSKMGADQKVQVASVTAASLAASSPLPTGVSAASEGLAIALTPAVEVDLSFVVAGLTARRQDDEKKMFYTHWLDKLKNEWKPLCSDHVNDVTAKTVTAPITTKVQEEDGFNPSSGCATGVTPCDGSGGTLLVLEVTDEPDCSGSGLGGGAIAGIVIGSLAGVGLIAGGAFMALKSKKESVETRFSNVTNTTAEDVGGGAELAFSQSPAVLYSTTGQETKV